MCICLDDATRCNERQLHRWNWQRPSQVRCARHWVFLCSPALFDRLKRQEKRRLLTVGRHAQVGARLEIRAFYMTTVTGRTSTPPGLAHAEEYSLTGLCKNSAVKSLSMLDPAKARHPLRILVALMSFVSVCLSDLASWSEQTLGERGETRVGLYVGLGTRRCFACCQSGLAADTRSSMHRLLSGGCWDTAWRGGGRTTRVNWTNVWRFDPGIAVSPEIPLANVSGAGRWIEDSTF